MNTNFIQTLLSEEGHPQHRDKLSLYAPLIGSWDFDWVGHEEDGSTWTVPGEWHFAWVLEGHVIQDNWICPRIDLRSSGKYPDGEYGTTLRYYDFKADCIKVVWVGPILSQFSIFEVHQSDGQIIQTEILNSEKEKKSKWLFKDISDTSFKWEAYILPNGEKDWILNQEVFARRRPTE